MKKGICYIIGAGDWYGYPLEIEEQDYVIAVDGGYNTLQRLGIKPDIIIGDFDSMEGECCGENIVRLNPIKDETDLLYSISYGEDMGYKDFYIFGGTGGKRISHTIANIQAISGKTQLHCYLFDREEVLFIIKEKKVYFEKESKGYLSVFSLSEGCNGVREKNLKYSLEDETITRMYPFGVSNEFIGKRSSISVKKGELLLVVPIEVLPYVTIVDKE